MYNPRIKTVEAGKVSCHLVWRENPADHAQTVIVANEQIDVFVTVSNPFAFDLEVADLSLM